MGGNVSLPEADNNTKRAMVLAHLKPREMKRLYKCFKKFDRDKIGKKENAKLMFNDWMRVSLIKLTNVIFAQDW